MGDGTDFNPDCGPLINMIGCKRLDYLRRLDSFDCRKLAMYMLSNGKKFLLLFCELFLQFHNNLHLGCNAGDFYKYSMTFYMKDKPKCVIPLVIPEYFK